MIIYCIENLINHKRYIGQCYWINSNDELQKSRMWGHGTYLKRSIKKYGIRNFKRWILIINIINFDELDRYEILWIKKLKTKKPFGYNLTDGGKAPHGYIFTEDQRKNQIEGMKRWWKDDKNKIKIKKMIIIRADSNRGKPFTKERKTNISLGLTGRTFSESHRQKLIESAKNRKFKPTFCIECHNEFVRINPKQNKCFSCKNKKIRIKRKYIFKKQEFLTAAL